MRVVACALRPGVRLLLGAAEVDQVGSQTVELVLDLRERVGAERGDSSSSDCVCVVCREAEGDPHLASVSSIRSR
jgi:hypothetical protein